MVLALDELLHGFGMDQCVGSIVMRVNDPGRTGPLPRPPAGAGPNFAEATKRR